MSKTTAAILLALMGLVGLGLVGGGLLFLALALGLEKPAMACRAGGMLTPKERAPGTVQFADQRAALLSKSVPFAARVTALARAVGSLDTHLVRVQGARLRRTLYTMTMPTSKDLVARCAADGEFALAARYWTGGLRLEIGEAVLEMSLENGRPCLETPVQRPNTIALSGPSELWSQLLAPVPPKRSA